ncbi:MAG: hypothetical protein PHR00_04760 [Patescibacteria group bacterium]|nr:hypothetical protein [Patescibacteria group bacterium]
MKKIFYIIPLVALSLLAIAPSTSIGAEIVQTPDAPIKTVSGFIDLLSYGLRILYTLFFILAVIFILMAGFGYLTAGGDPAKVKKASSKLIYGIIGVAVGLLATGVRALVENILGTK